MITLLSNHCPEHRKAIHACFAAGASWYVHPVTAPDTPPRYADTQLANRLIDRYGTATVTAALAPLLTDERVQRIEAVLDARLCGLTVGGVASVCRLWPPTAVHGRQCASRGTRR